MKEYSRKLLDKALDAIEAAEGLMDMGKAEFSAGTAHLLADMTPFPIWTAIKRSFCFLS